MNRPLPRFTQTALTHDPLEILIARREAEIDHARQQIAKGITPMANPIDLRGIPCLASGVGGTQAGTSPHGEAGAGRLDPPRRKL